MHDSGRGTPRFKTYSLGGTGRDSFSTFPLALLLDGDFRDSRLEVVQKVLELSLLESFVDEYRHAVFPIRVISSQHQQCVPHVSAYLPGAPFNGAYHARLCSHLAVRSVL